jgi:hypothetical protein
MFFSVLFRRVNYCFSKFQNTAHESISFIFRFSRSQKNCTQIIKATDFEIETTLSAGLVLSVMLYVNI